MQRNKIFNPTGDDSLENRTIIKGNMTGLFNLNAVKYPWAKNMYQLMVGNFWVPEKVSGLGDDASMYKKLDAPEQRAYRGIISFLTFLDSLQTVNLPNFADYITSSEVNLLLAIQSFQEAIHSQSYTTILETVVDAKERDKIYYFWRDDKVLLERNRYIGELYQAFIDDDSDENFFQALVANYLLEGLYFYNGFAFFDTLVYNQKMIATGRMINYIRRDELSHVVLFANIMKEIRKEFPDMWDEAKLREMFRTAVEQEIKWSDHILGNEISGISKESTEQYTKFLANERLSYLKLDPEYPEVKKNPYKHLEAMADNNSEKTNFFESTVVNYTQSSSLKGTWDF
ncbi:MAG: ribonucleotide-diphosphate reductase subunit beta [Candidatus Gracilibacteria bacterium]|nr:ribonucleotide-diphosphate reductase subunit beta [Candidatus Gracilibacteria bacterium]